MDSQPRQLSPAELAILPSMEWGVAAVAVAGSSPLRIPPGTTVPVDLIDASAKGSMAAAAPNQEPPAF